MTPRHLLAPARLAGSRLLATQSDERLVDLLRAGSEPAFEAIVSRYRGPLLRYCAALLGRERAEDAVQQTFVKAFEAMQRDDRHLLLRPWLYRIAHNTAHNALRDEPLGDEGAVADRTETVVERREQLRSVLASVQELPPRQRDALVLRELEGRSYEEISAALGVGGGAVRTKVAATALVTGAVAGGAAVAPLGESDGTPAPRAGAAEARGDDGGAPRPPATIAPGPVEPASSVVTAGQVSGDRGDNSGPGSGRDGGRGGGSRSESSGRGGGGSSGPGTSGSGTSGSVTSGSGISNSGTSGSGTSRTGSTSSGSGSDSSASGPSAPDSSTSRSGSPGADSSGSGPGFSASGSSGSGSGR